MPSLRYCLSLGALSSLALATLLTTWVSPAHAQCVDKELEEQLIGRRAYRGVVPRVFKKALRHELSALGGWYAADLSDGRPTYGGAYTFHFTEDLGLEASYLRTQRSFGFLEAVNDRQQNLTQITRNQDVPVQLFMGHLVWSLAYGKVRWFGGPIGRFDFYVALGAGATDEDGTSSVAGSGGFGMKFHLAQWMLLRFDIRDHVHSLRAPLGVEEVVNDITTLGGLSLFIPFSS
ncbi:MAG: outer membrane beta-barrel domain-containing protein [Deltaproteobacteria bacterium]